MKPSWRLFWAKCQQSLAVMYFNSLITYKQELIAPLQQWQIYLNNYPIEMLPLLFVNYSISVIKRKLQEWWPEKSFGSGNNISLPNMPTFSQFETNLIISSAIAFFSNQLCVLSNIRWLERFICSLFMFTEVYSEICAALEKYT